MLGTGLVVGLGLEVDEGVSPFVFAVVEVTFIVEDNDVGGPLAKTDPKTGLLSVVGFELLKRDVPPLPLVRPLDAFPNPLNDVADDTKP